MKPIWMYLNEAIDSGAAKNDSDIAAKLGITRTAVSDWRNGKAAPNDVQAMGLAKLLGLREEELMAECAAARAKTPETRAAWERIAKQYAVAASITAVTAIILVLCHQSPGSRVELSSGTGTVFIMLSCLLLVKTGWTVAKLLQKYIKSPHPTPTLGICQM